MLPVKEAFEGVRVEVAGVDLSNRAVDPESAIHVVTHERDVVAHHEDREPVVEVLQESQQFLLAVDVDSGCGFVEEEEVGL